MAKRGANSRAATKKKADARSRKQTKGMAKLAKSLLRPFGIKL